MANAQQSSQQHKKEEKEKMQDSKMFNPFEQWSKMFDKESMMNSHRKNLEALSEANQMATEVMKTINQLQNQYMKQTFEDVSKMMNEMMSVQKQGMAAPNAWAKHAEHIKDHFDRTMHHAKEVAEQYSKHHKKAYDLLNHRAKEGMEEMKNLQQKVRENFTKH